MAGQRHSSSLSPVPGYAMPCPALPSLLPIFSPTNSALLPNSCPLKGQKASMLLLCVVFLQTVRKHGRSERRRERSRAPLSHTQILLDVRCQGLLCQLQQPPLFPWQRAPSWLSAFVLRDREEGRPQRSILLFSCQTEPIPKLSFLIRVNWQPTEKLGKRQLGRDKGDKDKAHPSQGS